MICISMGHLTLMETIFSLKRFICRQTKRLVALAQMVHEVTLKSVATRFADLMNQETRTTENHTFPMRCWFVCRNHTLIMSSSSITMISQEFLQAIFLKSSTALLMGSNLGENSKKILANSPLVLDTVLVISALLTTQ